MTVIVLKKRASWRENLMWVKAQAAYKAGFRYTPGDHAETCNCVREYAVKAEPLTKQDMIDAMAKRTNQGDKR